MRSPVSEKACAKESDTNAPTYRISDTELAVFKGFSDPIRLVILHALAEHGELCVCHIIEHVGKQQSLVSHHLKVLKTAGLVRERKEGKWSYYRIADGGVQVMLSLAQSIEGE